MRSVSNLVVVTDGVTTVKELLKILRKHDYHGFPVIDKHGEYVGYTTRDELQLAIGIFAVSFLCLGGAN
jgi:chloride channel 3/4/5